MIDSELLAIIGLIYEGLLDPEGWKRALNAIRLRHGWYNTAMAINALPGGEIMLNVAINLPADFAEMADRFAADVMDMWGGAARIAQLPLEEPIVLSDVNRDREWKDNPYYRDWGGPLGLIDQVAIGLMRDRTAIANVTFGIHETTVVTPGMIDELRVLGPHLRRAATAAQLLELRETQTATLEAALDAARAGAILVRDDLQIVHANAAGEHMLGSADPVHSGNGRWRVTDEVVPGQLDGAVSAAAQGPAAMGRRGIGIPARRGDGTPLAAHVMPLTSRDGKRLEADAVVFVSDTGGVEPPPTQSLELLYGLTPAEVRAFELVAGGQSSEEMAQAMGVAPSTLRTHLLRVYDKTGRHSRAGLMQLARELKLPG